MLRVLTLNLWNDDGPHERRYELIRAGIDRLEPDLIGFQEVLRATDGDTTAGRILDGAGYHLDYGHARAFWKDESVSFGNAVASRWPIRDREEVDLPDNGDGESRTALSVTIDAPVGDLSFTCTHLNFKLHHGFVRERQVLALADLVLRRRPRNGFPPILVGDMNADPDSAEMRFLTGLQSLGGRSTLLFDAWRVAGGGGPGTTWSNRNDYARAALEPDRRIDYVLAGYPMRDGTGLIETCRVVCDEPVDGVWPSDHFGVLAELRTEPRP